jgi:16S rRNA (uracil1498-N3)-methyltransferase
MRRFILPTDYRGEETLRVSGKDAHYLARVLRLKPNDEFEAEDRAGGSYRARVLEATPVFSLALAKIDETSRLASAPDTDISLFVCLPKGAKLDLVARQATEAGVTRIVPVLSERAIPRPADWSAKRARLERVVREARQQSGSLRRTEILDPLSLGQAISLWAELCRAGRGPAFFFHESPLAETSLHRYLSSVPAQVALLIGPEGGLSSVETDTLRAAAWLPIFLGANVLRAETAALYAVAAVRVILLEHKTWVQNNSQPNA